MDRFERGRWLRRQRLQMGLHQHQLAALLGVNQGRVSEWENGSRPIPESIWTQIIAVLM